MSEYGVFADVVATAGALSSAAAAITLAFMKRSKWQPPEEALTAVASRFAALFAMIVIALLYVFSVRLGLNGLAILTVVFFLIAIVALWLVISNSINHSYYFPAAEIETNRKLGGNILTAEAIKIAREKGRSEKQMFQDAQGDKDLVWTRQSQFAVNIRTTLAFMALIGFGTCSLAAAAMLVVTFVANSNGS
jgi:hypothetical protein